MICPKCGKEIGYFPEKDGKGRLAIPPKCPKVNR